MPVTLQLRDVPRTLEIPLREAIDTALGDDWIVTLSQSHLDGLWHLQLNDGRSRCRAVLPPLKDVSVEHLCALLRDLSTATGSSGFVASSEASHRGIAAAQHSRGATSTAPGAMTR